MKIKIIFAFFVYIVYNLNLLVFKNLILKLEENKNLILKLKELETLKKLEENKILDNDVKYLQLLYSKVVYETDCSDKNIQNMNEIEMDIIFDEF